MSRDTFLRVGIVLLVAGLVMFLVFSPTYVSLSTRLFGYEYPSLFKSDFEYYILLSTTVMPILNLLIVIGVTLLLLGVLTKEKK